MKIAFIHYHLKTGGVTTVLKQQLDAIQPEGQSLVLTGLPPDTPPSFDIIHIPELAYSNIYKKPFNSDDVAEAIVNAIHFKFNGPCDLLHVHNPSLAKNKNFLKILKSLQKRGVKLFLQIHDFAEDGRPSAYFREEYPADCHYGVINLRDYNILLRAGLKKEGLHRLANTVNPHHFKQRPQAEHPFVLYPIRAIRRKNIGEAILLSVFFQNREHLMITLPPTSPMDTKSYTGWKAFAKDQRLKVAFDQGLRHDFKTMVLSSNFLITTSITEGFGFSFLEPWLFEKLLWGRKLPDICRDFEKKGIDFDHLYSKLLVPLDWIGHRQFYEKWSMCVFKTCEFFHFHLDKNRVKLAFDIMTKNGNIDFGLLDEASQKRVIIRLVCNRKDLKNLMRINPFLSNPGSISDKTELIKKNKSAVLKGYSKAAYRKRLKKIYHKVSTFSVKQKIDKKVLFSAFLKLEEFSLLKWSDYLE
jgi:hypothetical protein